jgi:formamidopyrimidine-DNA glycosylase
MPELPEVQTVVDSLRRLLFQTKRPPAIKRVLHLRDDIVKPPAGCDLRRTLAGCRILDVTRRAKRIIFTLDDNRQFFIHLGMTGRLTVETADATVRPHTHFIGELSDRRQLRFVDPRRFGRITWLGACDRTDDGKIGPEPLTIRASELEDRLKKTKRAIKTALLDQKLIAGIGNIYADEAMFSAGIHPLKLANELSGDEVRRLTIAMKKVLRRAIKHKGSTLRDYVNAEGQRGGFQLLHRVYAREGEPCVVCKSPISRIVLGGRSTHFCANCQRERGAGVSTAKVKRGRGAT